MWFETTKIRQFASKQNKAKRKANNSLAKKLKKPNNHLLSDINRDHFLLIFYSKKRLQSNL